MSNTIWTLESDFEITKIQWSLNYNCSSNSLKSKFDQKLMLLLSGLFENNQVTRLFHRYADDPNFFELSF